MTEKVSRVYAASYFLNLLPTGDNGAPVTLGVLANRFLPKVCCPRIFVTLVSTSNTLQFKSVDLCFIEQKGDKNCVAFDCPHYEHLSIAETAA
jgi:hypothetical protein